MDKNRNSQLRSLSIGLLFVFLFTVMIGRLFWIQTVDASDLRRKAEANWRINKVLEPRRGTIMDRNGNVLVQSMPAYVIAADVSLVKDPRAYAKKLSPLLGIPEDKLVAKLSKKKGQIELRDGNNYKVSPQTRDQIMKLGLDGIYSYPATMRVYMEGPLAAHVLGFVNMDDQATGGVEQRYDALLRGKPGSWSFQKDANGWKLSGGEETFRPPQDGKNLMLTIDSHLQYEVEQILEQAMRRYQAKAATAIVADPNTGEILAMANRPTFDPSQYAKTWKPGINTTNLAVSSQFEPGSTFKIVTLAAAIEEGVFHPDETYSSGAIQVKDRVIRDWNETGWGKIPFRQGVYLSSNVAFVLLGQALGADRLEKYIDRFGFGRITDRFGRKTGIDLPAEGRGIFYGRALYPSELATTAFGQGIAVTPIQQVAAISAIANGGKWVQPHVVKAIQDPDRHGRMQMVRPQSRNIISGRTAAQVRQLLRGVVMYGTGKEADLPGYDIAGKTGTAQKPSPRGGYIPGEYLVSFIGFAPTNHPKVVVYVAIDAPSASGGATGGTVAAPIAKEVFQKTFQVLHILPRTSTETAP
jgi:cell division protein FtsI/penicillin-binding protein 2